jgi:hypothetical protein
MPFVVVWLQMVRPGVVAVLAVEQPICALPLPLTLKPGVVTSVVVVTPVSVL